VHFHSSLYFIFLIFPSAWSYSSDKIKNNEVVGACGTFGGAERCIERFGGEVYNRQLGRPRCKWEDKTDIGRLWTVLVLGQDRDSWRALVNMLMNALFPHNARIFFTK
jgi:hypothetical protein